MRFPCRGKYFCGCAGEIAKWKSAVRVLQQTSVDLSPLCNSAGLSVAPTTADSSIETGSPNPYGTISIAMLRVFSTLKSISCHGLISLPRQIRR